MANSSYCKEAFYKVTALRGGWSGQSAVKTAYITESEVILMILVNSSNQNHFKLKLDNKFDFNF